MTESEVKRTTKITQGRPETERNPDIRFFIFERAIEG